MHRVGVAAFSMAAVAAIGLTALSPPAAIGHPRAAATASGTRAASHSVGPTCGGHRVLGPKHDRLICSFDDEFSAATGDAHKLDTSKWLPQRTADSAYTTGQEPYEACYLSGKKNIEVSHGKLRLTARILPHRYRCKSIDTLTGVTGHHSSFYTRYTAGMVSTYHRFQQTYGRFSVRAKLPPATARGLQETFWLYPASPQKYGGDDLSGEIDFAEFYSEFPKVAIPYIHYGYFSLPLQAHATRNAVTARCKIRRNAYNTYVLRWSPGTMRMSYNGTTCLVDHYASIQGSKRPFNQPFFLLLTQALGIATNAFGPSTHLPATTLIDYVRIWRQAK